jgi:hypothetical protein
LDVVADLEARPVWFAIVSVSGAAAPADPLEPDPPPEVLAPPHAVSTTPASATAETAAMPRRRARGVSEVIAILLRMPTGALRRDTESLMD